MEAKQPTEEQIKEFWEWCGITQTKGYFYSWDFPDGTKGNLPLIDLNNLFKYGTESTRIKIGDIAYGNLMRGWINGMMHGADPALALFWAIWEAIHGTT